MTKRLLLLIAGGLLFISLVAAAILAALWYANWTRLGPITPTGGLHFSERVVLPVPHFAQWDQRWGDDFLGPTDGTLRAEGCAVACGAMMLRFYGIDTNPGHLNRFLQNLPGGYTERGWIYWEKAAEMSGGSVEHVYEDDPSYELIDRNLLVGNPVIVRLRFPSGMTHFVVIVGKEGYDYLALDPGFGAQLGVYPLRRFGEWYNDRLPPEQRPFRPIIDGLRYYVYHPPKTFKARPIIPDAALHPTQPPRPSRAKSPIVLEPDLQPGTAPESESTTDAAPASRSSAESTSEADAQPEPESAAQPHQQSR